MNHFLSHLPPLNLPRQTVTRLQKGQGRLSVLVAALREAGYELHPAPEALAQKYGQREAARKATLSRNTITALTKGEGTVASYLQLATALKVEPRITKRKGYGACLSSRDQTWATPSDLLVSILSAAGREVFDLDPCSPSPDGPVPALTRWTEADDGLTRTWQGIVFVNPPYSRSLPKWVAKCKEEGDRGATVIGLVPSRTDTRWWHNSVVGQASLIMLKGRLRFGNGKGSAPFPSAIVVWGDSRLAVQIAGAIPGAWLIPSQKTAA
ncbi:MAG TPA: DNA N-6-adenine-methyltransferase [Acidiferrobacter sp.]|nr:DNA N-6-adenine-methyltransferase [Acidiferrobacter sp.]